MAQALLWNPEADLDCDARRRPGHPKKRWPDDLRQSVLSEPRCAEQEWSDVARTDVWRTLEGKFVSRLCDVGFHNAVRILSLAFPPSSLLSLVPPSLSPSASPLVLACRASLSPFVRPFPSSTAPRREIAAAHFSHHGATAPACSAPAGVHFAGPSSKFQGGLFATSCDVSSEVFRRVFGGSSGALGRSRRPSEVLEVSGDSRRLPETPGDVRFF